MNRIFPQLLFYVNYLRFRPTFKHFLEKAGDGTVIALADACIPELQAVAANGLSQCCEGFDGWTGTAPIILVRKRMLLTFMRFGGYNTPPDIAPSRLARKLLKDVDGFITDLQERLRIVGTDASINAYTTFANALEKAKYGGIMVREPLFIPAAGEADTLFVVFAGMCCFPEFRKSIAELGGADQLHILDPHRAWYMQDPDGKWQGFEFYSAILTEALQKITTAKTYRRICALGNSAGGAAALLFSAHVDRVLAFCPQTRISPQHIPAEIHDKYAAQMLKSIEAALAAGKSVWVHRGISETDIEQCSRLPDGVGLTIHDDFNKHNVPAHLKRKNRLIDVLRAAVADGAHRTRISK